MRKRFAPIVCILLSSALVSAAQPADRTLKPREVPCTTQYAQAVAAIGLARWSAPEPDRPAIERLLNAAASARDWLDASFLHWDDALCSTDTLGRLQASVSRLQASGTMPSTPADRSRAQAAAVNEELLKAMGPDAGSSPSSPELARAQPAAALSPGRSQ